MGNVKVIRVDNRRGILLAGRVCDLQVLVKAGVLVVGLNGAPLNIEGPPGLQAWGPFPPKIGVVFLHPLGEEMRLHLEVDQVVRTLSACYNLQGLYRELTLAIGRQGLWWIENGTVSPLCKTCLKEVSHILGRCSPYSDDAICPFLLKGRDE